MIKLSPHFTRLAAPGTGRRAVQLTSGRGFCYAMYYFIPSLSRDDRYLVYHRAEDNEVQLHRLDLTTGESVQLTHATYPHSQWTPWCTDTGKGVLDHRSVVNAARDQAIYFDGNVVRAVGIRTLDDRVLFALPEDRLASGQNCVSPDGQWFFYIHHDKDLYEAIYGAPGAPLKGGYQYPRHLSKGTKLAGYNLDTGEHRTLVMLNAPIHHVQPSGARHLVFSSLATERSILYTDYQGGWYTHLRTWTKDGGNTCHYCGTRRRIVYEAYGPKGMIGGMVSPATHKSVEFSLPGDSVSGHVGFDERGRKFFYERNTVKDSPAHDLIFLVRHAPAGDEWMPLSGDWPTYGGGQKAHFHPRLVLGGQWILICAGDPSSKTNHLFLLDASDLPESEGVAL